MLRNASLTSDILYAVTFQLRTKLCLKPLSAAQVEVERRALQNIIDLTRENINGIPDSTGIYDTVNITSQVAHYILACITGVKKSQEQTSEEDNTSL